MTANDESCLQSGRERDDVEDIGLAVGRVYGRTRPPSGSPIEACAAIATQRGTMCRSRKSRARSPVRVPVMIPFYIAQRQLLSGLTAGGVKG